MINKTHLFYYFKTFKHSL